MAKLDDLFKLMVNQGASDLHLTAGAPPCLRINGDIEKLEYRDLSHDECKALIFEILNEEQRKLFVKDWDIDCAYQVPGVGRFRCNIFLQRKGIAAVFRHIPEKILSMKDLNLPQQLYEVVKANQGLILVTGPTGSGKSTTLAAMINELNETQKLHILTLEDPIEFVHPNKMSIVNQREVYTNTKSFDSALKAALREDPDVILVGELRDPTTISLALKAAETGHLVFGTLHTLSAVKTVDRLIDSFPEDQQSQVRTMLSESLNAVVSQILLPKLGGKGRVAAHEILIGNVAVSNLIRENKIYQIRSTMQTAKHEGMQTLDEALENLMNEGKISIELGKGLKSKGVSTGGSHAAPTTPTRPGIPQNQPTGSMARPGIPQNSFKKPS